ncbi:MAG: sulfatase [Lentisphaeria bacterium]|nr:sulfatase [Lentisphaeria bacterium]
MGSSFYETTHIDALAAEGSLFTNAYASSANCAPSRACMLTGQYPSRHGIYTVGSSERGESKTRRLIPIVNQTNLPEGMPTMASILSELGYDTGIIGKWHISSNPKDFGFESNIAGCHKGHPGSYFAPYDNPALPDGPDGEYLPERLANEASAFIKQERDKPFFLYYSTYLVHTPIQGRDDLIEKYKKKLKDGLATEGHHNPVYAAMIEALDNAVGQVMQTLEEEGIADNTLVIFISDNGGIRSISHQTPLRAGKGSYYEGGTRVPCIARWPKKIPQMVSDYPFTNMDFLPTFIKLAGGSPADYQADGTEISLQLQGKSKELKDRPLFWHFPVYLDAYEPATDDGRDPLFRTRPGSIVRLGDWKLHHYYEDGAYELYNLKDDMGERHNLIDRDPDRAQELIKVLNTLRQQYDMPGPLGPNPEFDATYTKELEDQVVIPPAPSSNPELDWYRVMQFID